MEASISYTSCQRICQATNGPKPIERILLALQVMWRAHFGLVPRSIRNQSKKASSNIVLATVLSRKSADIRCLFYTRVLFK